MNVKKILVKLAHIFFQWNSFLNFFEACFNFSLIIVLTSHCKRKKTVFFKKWSSHTTSRLLGGLHATFHTSIASEFCGEACDCRTPLFFVFPQSSFLIQMVLSIRKGYQRVLQFHSFKVLNLYQVLRPWVMMQEIQI